MFEWPQPACCQYIWPFVVFHACLGCCSCTLIDLVCMRCLFAFASFSFVWTQISAVCFLQQSRSADNETQVCPCHITSPYMMAAQKGIPWGKFMDISSDWHHHTMEKSRNFTWVLGKHDRLCYLLNAEPRLCIYSILVLQILDDVFERFLHYFCTYMVLRYY